MVSVTEWMSGSLLALKFLSLSPSCSAPPPSPRAYSDLAAPSHHPSCSLQMAAMHSDCMFKQEQALCLEKIRKANELMGLNASSHGE